MTTYLALTLGPIHKTIMRQRKTRAVFAASYLFSYTMKKVMEKLLQGGIKSEQILMPSPKYLNHSDYVHTGCGLYADRLIMIAQQDGDFDLLLKVCEEVFSHLAGKLEKDENKFTKAKILPYLKQYLQVHCLRMTLEKGKDTINEINQILDSLELKNSFPYGADNDYLQEFFSRVGGHFLLKDAFGSQRNKSFDSLEKIATRGLGRLLEISGKQDKKKEYDQAFEKEEEENEKESEVFELLDNTILQSDIQPYHRYVAVVLADADSLGRYVGNLNADEQKLLAVSDQLFELGLSAKNVINNYGGASVYIGGDDLLFFAPVVSINTANRNTSSQTQTEHIFDLIEAIDNQFYKQFEPSDGSPTLSYGVCIFYHKFPLNEALAIARDLLSKAKNKRHHPSKNTIAFKILKHSGQTFEAAINKIRHTQQADGTFIIPDNNTVHSLFKKLLVEQVKGANFINSITHGISFFQDLLGQLIVEEKDLNAVQNLFDNTFNENIHHQNRAFINSVVQFIIAVFQEVERNYPNTATRFVKNQTAVETVYATLRFINFVKEKNNANVFQN